jgi:hypothetical protein
VGGLATFAGVGLTQWLSNRQARVEAKEQALISARIVQSELAWAETRVGQALDTGKYWSAAYGLEESDWLAHREQLAIALDDPGKWSTVRDGFRSMHVLELQASKRRPDHWTKVEINDWGRKELDHGLGRIRAAIDVLRPLAQDRARVPLGKDPTRSEAEPAIERLGGDGRP